MESKTRLMQSILNPPPPLNDAAYSGYYYAFYGAGGYSTDQSFNPILLSQQAAGSFQLYDVTYAVQVKFDVRTINEKIGLLKDASNEEILDSSYNIPRNSFPIDSISISANEFVNGMNASQVISVGAYQTMYNDYMETVNVYFLKIPTIDDSLFSAASSTDISNGLFDANQFMNLIYQQVDASHQYTNPLNGFVTLSNINQLLRYSVDSNIFGNRQPLANDASVNITPITTTLDNTIHFNEGTVTDTSTNTITITHYDAISNTETITIQDNSNNTITTIIDDISNNLSTVTTKTEGKLGNGPSTSTGPFNTTNTPTYADVSFSTVPGNYGVGNGFLAGDLIFIPGGLSATLEVLIDPMIDASTSSIYDLILNSGLAYDYAIDLSNIATQKTTMIQKILTAPLLIELANLS